MTSTPVDTMLRIPADLDADLTLINVPEDGRLGALQAYVGGYVEAVALGVGDGILLCNEQGKLRGLLANQRAQEIAAEAGLSEGDILRGDVLLCGDADSDFGPVSTEMLRFVDARLLTALSGA